MKRSVLFLVGAILMGAGLLPCDSEDNNGDNNGGGSGGGNSSVVWIDLGLPSGLLWADRNVGASSPEDYGSYYAWGETTPKNVYDKSTYAYGSDDGEFTKYCNKASWGLNGFTDNLITLQASDDAATANLGDGARTPTENEWRELIDNTTSTWTTQNGVYGRLLTSYNGKSLFLPAAGGRDGSDLDKAGEYGGYWSSSLHLDYPCNAWSFFFGSSFQSVYYDIRRWDGISIRAVRASQN